MVNEKCAIIYFRCCSFFSINLVLWNVKNKVWTGWQRTTTSTWMENKQPLTEPYGVKWTISVAIYVWMIVWILFVDISRTALSFSYKEHLPQKCPSFRETLGKKTDHIRNAVKPNRCSFGLNGYMCLLTPK